MPGFYDSDSDDSTVDGSRESGGLRESVHVSACIVCLVAAAGLDVLWRRR